MIEPMSAERLEEIRRHDAAHDPGDVRSDALKAAIRNFPEAHRRELLAEVDRLRAELTDEIEWGIGCPEDGGAWYQGNFTQRGARHHAVERGGGHFPAWRRLANWHNANEEQP